jgi:hypothetical protein
MDATRPPTDMFHFGDGATTDEAQANLVYVPSVYPRQESGERHSRLALLRQMQLPRRWMIDCGPIFMARDERGKGPMAL